METFFIDSMEMLDLMQEFLELYAKGCFKLKSNTTIPSLIQQGFLENGTITLQFETNFVSISNGRVVKTFGLYDCSFGSFLKGKKQYFRDFNKTKKLNKQKENNKMFKFDFGPCTGNSVKMSMYGLAILNNSGTWVSYKPDTKEIVDVDILNFNGEKFLFKVPVSLKDIQVGDTIIHNRVPMFVTSIKEDKLIVIDVRDGEEKTILPTKNMFGFNFVTKVISIIDLFKDQPTDENPFGNILPLLMMDNDGENNDSNMFLALMMSQNKTNLDNPMLLYMLCNNNSDSSNMLPLFLLMNNSNK